MICKNCEHIYEGKFCSKCGQKSSAHRLNFKYLINEITSSVFQVDRGIFYTVKELFLRPGHSIREFLDGKRVRYFKPLSFVFLTSTLYFLITLYLLRDQTFLEQLLSGMQEVQTEEKTQTSSVYIVVSWLAHNYAYASLLIIPIFSLASYLAFARSGRNYIEHIVLNSFISGQQMLIYIVFNFVFFYIPYLNDIAPYLSILYLFWAFMQFFQGRKTFVKILLTVLTYIIVSVIWVLLVLFIKMVF